MSIRLEEVQIFDHERTDVQSKAVLDDPSRYRFMEAAATLAALAMPPPAARLTIRAIVETFAAPLLLQIDKEVEAHRNNFTIAMLGHQALSQEIMPPPINAGANPAILYQSLHIPSIKQENVAPIIVTAKKSISANMGNTTENSAKS
jgi:hypothetical protein